ncbi:MAG: EF-P lysine aminoacylase EpmA [Gammaproteobacteria bacterium]|nr:EF-P lysine aminoacylase EpmA [Gammaproteobacteria bacterium]
MLQTAADWRPAASLDALKLRATLLARIRKHFSGQGVLEVDTPVLSTAGATDPAIRSFTTTYHGPVPVAGRGCDAKLYLHTSPEFPMKRLLAAGSGSIFQVCKVFRDGESGSSHNPEFTLLEWYRTGFDHFDLMDDVEKLLRAVLDGIMSVESVDHWTYRDLFIEVTGMDPFTATVTDMQAVLQEHCLHDPVGLSVDDRDAWLDMLMTHVIEPGLGEGLVFVRDYPASQAALARLRPGQPAVAARFEVYLGGIELANGYHELTDATEQQQRFAKDNARRVAHGAEPVAMDRHLLAAMQSGLPDCAGVALGIDRLLMLAGRADTIDAMIAFPLSNA